MVLQKFCIVCDEEYETYEESSSYCSRECYGLDMEVTNYNTCEECGEEYEVSSYRQNKSKYCSYECSGKGRTKDSLEKECNECGEVFTVKPHEDHRRFCSIDCSGSFQPTNHVTTVCEWCGDKREDPPSRANTRRFCSNKCNNKWKSVTFTGENHPRWKEDTEYYTYYGPNWKEIREEILERDNYECQCCGIGDDLHRLIYSFGIDVHHVEKLSSFEEDKFDKAHDKSNLISTCRCCHSGIE